MTFIERVVATAGFAGYSSFAPGTCGSAVALVIYLLLPPLTVPVWCAVLVALFLVAVWASEKGETEWGHDPGPVVIDEVAGFFVSVAFLPQSLLLGIAGFFGFRALDILKPAPASQAERLPGGWGVVMDDVIAGIYVNLILRAGLYWFGDSLPQLT